MEGFFERTSISHNISYSTSQTVLFTHTVTLQQETCDLSLPRIKTFYLGLGYDLVLSYDPADRNGQVHRSDTRHSRPPLRGWKLVEYLLGKQKEKDAALTPIRFPRDIKRHSSHGQRDRITVSPATKDTLEKE